jgi:hypothetical protein
MTARTKTLLNIGCGPLDERSMPPYFAGWNMLRVDVDPATKPDILADACDLSIVDSGTADAIWCAHCVEHLYIHDVPRALGELYRVLAPTGFLCVIVPDLQVIAGLIAQDRMHEAAYVSAAGPVTPHDIVYGFAPALARGEFAMAHRSGFTPTAMMQQFSAFPFAEVVLRRRPNLELAALGRKSASGEAQERDALVEALAI